MQMESCQKCLNLEDRRKIDNIALCTMHHEPSVSCPEFKPEHDEPESEQFCTDCAYFESVGGVPLCAKHHSPDVVCNTFRNRI